MKLLAFVIIVNLLFPDRLYAQNQERQVITYNILFGGIISGVGAVINKPSKASFKKYLLKGFWQGSVGGLLNYSGKKTLYLINYKNELGYGWPAKILQAAGCSIIENASTNKPFLQNWNIDYGPVRVDFSTNGTKKAKLRLLPNGIYAIYWGIKYGSFDLKTTIYTGNVAFKSYNPNINIGGTPTIGHSFDRAFIYTVNQLNNTNIDNTNRIIAHEIVHLFQYREYQLLNTWVKPLEKKVTSKFLNAIFSKYIYADIPYFWGAYRLAGSTQEPHYYRNYFEFEAERMATNRQILNR